MRRVSSLHGFMTFHKSIHESCRDSVNTLLRLEGSPASIRLRRFMDTLEKRWALKKAAEKVKWEAATVSSRLKSGYEIY